MEIYSTALEHFVIVETDIGEFKVIKTGEFTRWSCVEKNFVEFDRDNFKKDQLYEIFKAGNQLLFDIVDADFIEIHRN